MYRMIVAGFALVAGLTGGSVLAEEVTVEPPESCDACGMSRWGIPESRVFVVYRDSTTAGFCSIHCAAAEMKTHAERPVRELRVADYATSRLIDAASAVWVVGGCVPGVMTSQAKWAFAREDDAQAFIAANGGERATYQQVLAAAQAESDAVPTHGHDHSQNGVLAFNPGFGEDIYHVHPAGMWMINYRYARTSLNGLRDGTSDVSVNSLTPAPYMMAPTHMDMDMHMLMVMYGLTDAVTLMGMGSFVSNDMEMVMNMGMGNTPMPTMHTSGVGDTELRAIYGVNKFVVASLGLGIPTGDIDQQFVTMGKTYHAPYDMQLGSGTVDLKPAATVNFYSDDAAWNLGGQAMYTVHIGRNSNGYSLGDGVRLNTWLQYALAPLAVWTRLAYSDTGRINGRDPEIQRLLDEGMMPASTPDADPWNYGGQRIDGFVGASIVGNGVGVGIELGMPVYQDLNGPQLKTDWYLTAGPQFMF